MGWRAKSDEVAELEVKAEAGDISARRRLGIAYAEGKGVPKDPVEAVRHYLIADEGGDMSANFMLATAYALGEGVDKDLAEAARRYKIAATAGDEDAELPLRIVEDQLKQNPGKQPHRYNDDEASI